MDTADPSGAHRGLGRGEGARESGREEDGDDLVGFGAGVAEDPDEVRGSRLGGGGQVPGAAEPAVEVLRLELDPVTEGLVPEHHLERNQRDVMPVQHRVGQVG